MDAANIRGHRALLLDHISGHCAGVAMGIDRLLMAMLATPRICDVTAFDFSRA